MVNLANMKNDLNGIRVLVIDDDDIVLTVMKSALEGEGCSVTTMIGGIEALNQLDTIHSDFDIIILDYVMPDLNGDDILMRIRSYEENNNLSPIAVFSHSGHITHDQKDELIEKGYTDIMVKPVDLDDLFEKVLKYYNKSQID